MAEEYDVIVIGAGQAGLAMGYYLQQLPLSFLLLDSQQRVGDSWRNRYDSLVLFTPRRYSQLPGYLFPGEPDGLPDKDEVADYLERYAAFFRLPIQHSTTVRKLEKIADGFRVAADGKEYLARQVVIATGPFQQPSLPAIGANASAEVRQIHTAAYKNASQLRDGPVLVVGAGNSGVQIAVELAAEREVILSVGQPRRFLPLSFLGKNIFWYFDKLGLLSADVSSKTGAWLSRRPDPIFGYKTALKALAKQGNIRLEGRTVHIAGRTVGFAGGGTAEVSNIIWASGFQPDYGWIDVPGVIGEGGKPLHARGVSPVNGIFFLGLPWQRCRKSALIGGVGDDAQFIASMIIQQGLQVNQAGRNVYGSAP
jgi:putative flavoprotein involved in K+ transport